MCIQHSANSGVFTVVDSSPGPPPPVCAERRLLLLVMSLLFLWRVSARHTMYPYPPLVLTRLLSSHSCVPWGHTAGTCRQREHSRRPALAARQHLCSYRLLLQRTITCASIMPTRARTCGSIHSLLSHTCVLTSRSSTQRLSALMNAEVPSFKPLLTLIQGSDRCVLWQC